MLSAGGAGSLESVSSRTHICERPSGKVGIDVPVEAREHPLVLAPAGLQADLEVQVDPLAEELLQVEARGGADRLDLLPLVTDEDLLLARPLDEDRGVDLDQVAPLLLFP